MSPFYTRSGDDGYTGRLGEGRVPKDDLLIEALGTIDHATASLGFARSLTRDQEVAQTLVQAQNDLYQVMAELAATEENVERFRTIDAARVVWLERVIAGFESRVTMPDGFIIPGDSPSAGAMALARTSVRAAERAVVRHLHQAGLQGTQVHRYLNRLSSLCFVLELWEQGESGSGPLTLAGKGLE
jgi:cob(I)alamin adenosyltransferase